MSDAPARFDLDALDGRVADDPGAPEFPALAEALRRSGSAERARDVAVAGLESAPSRLAGRVALALAQMDLGAFELGRSELEGVLDEMLEPYRLGGEPECDLIPVAGPAVAANEIPGGFSDAHHPMPLDHSIGTESLESLGEHEIDAAFDQAEPRSEEMHSANSMAERVLEAEVPIQEPAGTASPDPHAASDVGDFDIAASGAFTTRTMAGLLERQGDHHQADSIREALAAPSMKQAGEWPEPRDVDAAEAPADVIVEASLDGDSAYRERVVATLEQWLHNIRRRVA